MLTKLLAACFYKQLYYGSHTVPETFTYIIPFSLYNANLCIVLCSFKGAVKMRVYCLDTLLASSSRQLLVLIMEYGDTPFSYKAMDKHLEHNVIKMDLFCFTLCSYIQS